MQCGVVQLALPAGRGGVAHGRNQGLAWDGNKRSGYPSFPCSSPTQGRGPASPKPGSGPAAAAPPGAPRPRRCHQPTRPPLLPAPQQVFVLPLQRAQPLLAGQHAGAVGVAQLRHLRRQLVHLQGAAAGRLWSAGAQAQTGQAQLSASHRALRSRSAVRTVKPPLAAAGCPPARLPASRPAAQHALSWPKTFYTGAPHTCAFASQLPPSPACTRGRPTCALAAAMSCSSASLAARYCPSSLCTCGAEE